MTTEQFKSTLRLQPFKPFTIRMADGRTFEIPHPDFIAQSPSGRVIIVFHPDDSYSLLDLLLMTEVEVQKCTRPMGVLPNAAQQFAATAPNDGTR